MGFNDDKYSYALREKCPYFEFFLRTQSKCGKMRTRKAPNMDTFHAVMWTRNLASAFSTHFTPLFSF